MTKLRASYSILDAWERGKTDDVVDMYFKLGERKPTRAMEEGLKIHSEVEDYVTTYNSFPTWLFAGEGGPIMETEKKIVVPYNELIDLVGVIDCLDLSNKTMYEFKTGVQTSTDYVRSHQIPLYFLLCNLSKIEIEKAYLLHYNQHTESKDFTLVWNSEEQLEKARNYIDSVAPEIYYFFKDQGLI
jgi:hypothetical protein